MTNTCKFCGGRILWGYNPQGKSIPKNLDNSDHHCTNYQTANNLPPNPPPAPAPMTVASAVPQAPVKAGLDKDRLIVRQSSLAQAVKAWCCANHANLTPEETVTEIKKIAESFEEWVFRE